MTHLIRASHARRAVWLRCLLIVALALAITSPTLADKGGPGRHKAVKLAPVAPPRVVTQLQHPPTRPPKSSETPEVSKVTTFAAPGDHAISPRAMKLLLIAADGNETDFPALKAFLDQLGVPYDVLIAVNTPLTADRLWDGVGQGYYAGIILTTGTLNYYDPATNTWPSAFDDTEWNTLWAYEASFGVRQVTSYTAAWGYPDYGLSVPTYVDTTSTPLQTALTEAGKSVYSYLNAASPITIRNAWVYLSTITDPANTTPLLTTANGYAIASIHTYPDGRQNLAITAANNPYLIHSLLLSYGTINWVSKGLFLGERHVYMSPQIDDLLIDDDIWDTVALTDTTGLTYRLTAADYNQAIAWQNNVRNDCVTLQPAPAAGMDTYILYEKKDNNFGNAPILVTDSERAGRGPARSLVQFNLTGIPAGATITAATLRLYLSKNTGSQADVVEAHRLTRSWVEGNSGKNKGATWNRYDGLHAWLTPGGDYDATLAGSFVASGIGWKSMAITGLVQDWFSGKYPNQGLILLSAPRIGDNEKQYYSSDNANAQLRPALDVCYYTSTAPGGLAAALTLEMAFNGEGAVGTYTPDTLTPAVQANQTPFRWINHTYSHLNLDPPTTYAQSLAELTQNDAIAVNQFHFTNYYRDALVQPDISGLEAPEFQSAAVTFGLKYLIADTSRSGWNNPSPNAGFYSALQPGLLIIPRRPTNLFYNLTTPDQFVSEYNCYYGPAGTCADGQWRYWDHNLTYAEILDKESDMWLQYLLKWDMDPLMFHQANLRAYDGVHSLFSDLVDATLAKYRQMMNLPLRSEAQHTLGVLMANRMAYNAAGVTASLIPCTSLSLTAAQDVIVPVTGVSYGAGTEVYGGQAISYVPVTAGAVTVVPLTCP